MIAHEQTLTHSPSESAVRARILAAARAFFFAHGFRSVTMDQLAAELGMSKKTLYAHFSSKSALLRGMLDARFQELEGELERVVSDCAGDFHAGLQRLLAHVQQHTSEIQPPFLRDMQREGPELFKLVEERRRRLIQRYFGQVLESGRRQGLIRKDIPVQLVIEILLAAVQGIMNPARMDELGLTPATGYPAILSVVLEGAIQRKPKPEK